MRAKRAPAQIRSDLVGPRCGGGSSNDRWQGHNVGESSVQDRLTRQAVAACDTEASVRV